jgi:lysozyme
MSIEPRAQGIDVSRHQPSVDWQAVKNAGTAFVFMKATDGSSNVDIRFSAYWAGAKAAGLLRGAYHYYQPSHDPLAQARNLARVIASDPGELPPVLDLEEGFGATTGLRAQVETWLREVEIRLKRRPLIYTSRSRWHALMRDASGQFPAWAKDYFLWVANYPAQKTPQSQPLLPDSWSTWTFWQYSSSGSVTGIPGPVDLDEFNGPPVDLMTWARRQRPINAWIPKVTNQEMINAFSRAFGPAYWDVVTRAGLTELAVPASNRPLLYAGPPIDALPNLTAAEKVALKRALPPTGVIPRVTNQEMINAFSRAFGPAYWDVVTRAGLTDLAVPASNRPLPYAGPPVDEIPDLTAAEKVALKRALPPNGVIPRVTNQEMINAFSRAFGPTYWEVVTLAGLTDLAVPASNRPLPYAGPPIDDLPNLIDLEKAALKAALQLTWIHHALPGLHGPADPGNGWVPEAFEAVRQSKVRAVKMLAPDLQPGEVAALRNINPDMFIMARLFSGQLNNPQGDGTPEGAGRWFANEIADATNSNNPMNRAYNSGLRYFEVHNEPNLSGEGLGVNWRDGAEFARFFNTVVAALKPRYPEARFGFPGLSPGPVAAQRPVEAGAFLQQAADAVARADFLGCHVYWGRDGVTLESALNDLRLLCDLYPHKLILCTEFANNRPDVPREQKADEYARFYVACRSLPANLGGTFVFALSWRGDSNNTGFLRLSADGTRWEPTPMAARLGSHDF